MNYNTFTRQEFHEMVWQEPFSSIILKYKTGYDGIRAICREHNIPFPQTGYWMKLRYGKAPDKLELPTEYQGNNRITLDLRTENDFDSPRRSERLKRVETIMQDSTLSLDVAKRLSNPDPLIVAAKNNFEERSKERWYLDRGMARTDRGFLNIRVSPNLIPRALRFMDALIKLLRSRGHSIKIQYDDTYAVISDEDFKIKLMEVHSRFKKDEHWGSTEYIPTGKLAFKFIDYHGQEWVDGRKPIEERLAEILAKLELEAQREKEQRAANAEERRIREERERIAREEQARRHRELNDFKSLYTKAKQWQQARFMRDYLKALKADAVAKNNLTEDLSNWLQWANEKVDWYDPLVNKKDQLLDHFYKDEVL